MKSFFARFAFDVTTPVIFAFTTFYYSFGEASVAPPTTHCVTSAPSRAFAAAEPVEVEKIGKLKVTFVLIMQVHKYQTITN